MSKRRLKHLNSQDSWMLAEDIPDIDLFFSQIWLSCFANEFVKPGGFANEKVMAIYKGYHLWFYFGEDDSFKQGKHLVEKFVKNPQFTVEVNEEIVKWSDKLRYFAHNLPQENLEKLTKKQLWFFYQRHDEIHTKYYQWGWLPVAADMFHNDFTEELKKYLKSIGVRKEKINEYLVTLTVPEKKSLIQIEREEFLTIASKIQKDSYHKKLFRELYQEFLEYNVSPYGLETHTPEYEAAFEKKVAEMKDQIKMEILKLIEQHYIKYHYVKFMWIGKDGIYTFDYYLKELVKLIGEGINVVELLKDEINEHKNLIIKRNTLIKKLKIKNPWKTIFTSWADFMITKIYRRFAQIYAIYNMQPVLEEIARRLDISLMQVRFMLKSEIGDALIGGKKPDKKALQKRTKYCVYYAEKGIEKVFVGNEAKKMAEKTKIAIDNEITEVQGQCGCVGRGRGAVKLIIRSSDMNKMKNGDVLVSIATDPDIVPAMKKASAIVTEQGGVTSHAAIISRELGIPCVIGTKIATKVFKDGDLVEVDATKGIVRKI
ncbi:MAG: PEP-utilizing enzyme [Patescibacteria group bacterium]|jgi:phosphohistidine swiveling domain-containing protein